MCATVGGSQERVHIYLIANPDDDQMEARRLLTKEFATFNAGKAQCFLASDREHLLAVIEAGFGDFNDFNRVVRNLLASRVSLIMPTLTLISRARTLTLPIPIRLGMFSAETPRTLTLPSIPIHLGMFSRAETQSPQISDRDSLSVF